MAAYGLTHLKVLEAADRFLLAHLSAPLDVCRGRSASGSYQATDVVLATDSLTVDECVEQLVAILHSRGALGDARSGG